MRELKYRADTDEVAFASVERNDNLKQWALESKLQAKVSHAKSTGEIRISISHQMNRQALAFRDGIYYRVPWPKW